MLSSATDAVGIPNPPRERMCLASSSWDARRVLTGTGRVGGGGASPTPCALSFHSVPLCAGHGICIALHDRHLAPIFCLAWRLPHPATLLSSRPPPHSALSTLHTPLNVPPPSKPCSLNSDTWRVVSGPMLLSSPSPAPPAWVAAALLRGWTAAGLSN